MTVRNAQKVVGFSFPFSFGPTGSAKSRSGVSKLVQNMQVIALTRRGERPREKGAGTIGYSLTYRNFRACRLSLVLALVHIGVTEQEPRVAIHDHSINEKTQTDGAGVVSIILPFEVVETGVTGSADITIKE